MSNNNIQDSYELLREFPGLEVGDTVSPNSYGIPVHSGQLNNGYPFFYSKDGSCLNSFIPASVVRNNPDWFRKVVKKEPDTFVWRKHPTEEDLDSNEFNAIWDVIKGWDLRRNINDGYAGASGTDVMTILNSLRKNSTPKEYQSGMGYNPRETHLHTDTPKEQLPKIEVDKIECLSINDIKECYSSPHNSPLFHEFMLNIYKKICSK